MNNALSLAEALENIFILHQLSMQRRYRLEKIQSNVFMHSTAAYTSEAIFNDNADTDMELLLRFTSQNYTPPVVDELHLKRCLDSGVEFCTCLVSKDDTVTGSEVPL